jgi:hypothetical protein
LILRYTVGYHSNDTAYASLIQELADTSACRVAIIQGGGAIAIYVEGSEDEIKEFFGFVGRALPLCLYVAGSHAEEVESFPAHAGRIDTVAKTMAMRPEFMSSLIDETNQNYLDPFWIDESAKSVSFDGKEFVGGGDEFKSTLAKAAKEIASGKSVSINGVIYSISPDSSKSVQSALCINLNIIATALKLSNTAIFTISAMQRPIATIGVVDESETAYFVKVALPSEPFMLCLAKLLNDNGASALYIQSGGKADIAIATSGFESGEPKIEVLVQNNEKLILSAEAFDETLLPITTDAFAANFSHTGKSSFVALKPAVMAKEILHIDGFVKSFVAEITALDENGPKLMQNFKNKFPKLYDSLDKTPVSADFAGFLDGCAAILGVTAQGSSLAALVLLAHKNKAPAGVKIDFILEATGGKPTLNLVKSLRTLLSYKLADVEDETLAFSVFESLADFVTVLCDEARKGFDAKELVLCGGLFFAEALTTRVVSKVRNLHVSSAYIPQIFD